MPDFTASPLVDALEENLFSLLEKLAAEVNTEVSPLYPFFQRQSCINPLRRK